MTNDSWNKLRLTLKVFESNSSNVLIPFGIPPQIWSINMVLWSIDLKLYHRQSLDISAFQKPVTSEERNKTMFARQLLFHGYR